MREPLRHLRWLTTISRKRTVGAPLSAAALLLAGTLLLTQAARADKGLNDGVFRDRDGKSHNWSVDRSHVLNWDNQPYVPSGVVFHSTYLLTPSDQTLAADVAELDRLKSAGVKDIWVDCDRGLLECTVQQTQAFLDALEARGLRYGLRIGDRSREPLVGFSPTLRPVAVPKEKLQPGARESWKVKAPQARRVIYNLVDLVDEKTEGMSVNTGQTVVERDQADIEIQIRKSSLLGRATGTLYVVPEIQVDPSEVGSFGDLWAGMETYSDRLQKHLAGLKFGPGLRFILDPFVAGDGTVGREDTVFPSSPSFHKAFAEWLKRREGSGISSLNTSWRMRDKRVPTFDEAARLVPMWDRNDPPERDGWLFDPVEKIAYRCKPTESSIWTDLDTFRADTLKRWMNILSINMKQDGTGVPVLFSWSAYHPIFNNSPAPGGYDGLGAQVYGQAPDVATRSAAYALAQAEEADRHTWLIATRMAGPRDAHGNPTEITDSGTIRGAWNAVREAGFRGVFLDPKELPKAVSFSQELGSQIASESA
ncbi:MAG: hypothetical protein K0Q72_5231, partial [Armatimonadetes bacterium]|nr:hypothetical protein [Armatimonadota bacterium]